MLKTPSPAESSGLSLSKPIRCSRVRTHHLQAATVDAE